MGKHRFNIHERFLRHIWSQQYLQRQALKTTDGQIVRVRNAGILNPDSGPDFRDAVLSIGSVTYCGDVEIHRTVVEWMQHQHQNDPRYNRVILHVALEQGPGSAATLVTSGRHVPVVILEPFLSESIRTLWQKTILDERIRSRDAIPCFGRNQAVSLDLLCNWLRRLATERLELKLRRFDERLRELAHFHLLAVHDQRSRYGRRYVQGNPDDVPPPQKQLSQKDTARREFWDQLIYEGFMECLGYSKNQEPFARLARGVTLQEIRSQRLENNEVALQALLLGAAGLLPKVNAVNDRESRAFLRLLAAEWRTLKRLYRSTRLHLADWQFFPTRPGNFPTIRIAAASMLIRKILRDDLFRKLIEILKTPMSGAARISSIRLLLEVDPHPFWRHHYQFEHVTTKPVCALGPERTDDLITNAVIPLALLYARTFRDRIVREETLRLFDAMPPAKENSITRLMEQQLLHRRLPLTSVGVQQGLIQLYKFYCTEKRCIECEVGAFVFRRDGV